MKKRGVFLILCALLSLAPVYAGTVYYVDGTSGSDQNSGLTLQTAWKTINKANTTLVAGDTVYILAGTYSENNSNSVIRPTNSGSAGNYITYRNYPGSTPILGGCYQPVCLWSKDYIWVEGVEIDGSLPARDRTNYGVRINSNYNVIKNCHIHDITCGADGADRAIFIQANCHHNKILYNRLYRGGAAHPPASDDIGDSLWLDYGCHHNLVEGNDFYNWGHFSINAFGNHNIFRNNTMRGGWGTTLGLHGDNNSTPSYCVAENNVLWDVNIAEDSPSSPYEASQISSYNAIFRRNKIFYAQGHGLHIWGSNLRAPNNAKIYNNVIYHTGLSTPVGSRQAIMMSAFNSRNNLRGIALKNNIFWANGEDGIAYNEYAQAGDQVFANNHWIADGDPLFADAENYDFHLSSSSPCIDAGAFLTRAKWTGSGTQLEVEDVSFFMDGFGLVEGDLVQLEGQTETARAVSVNYGANTLTLDRSLSWYSGQGVSLAYSGAVPDLGAFESESGNPQSPVAAFNPSPDQGDAPLLVNFDASSSYDPDGSITSYDWDFGDGTTGSGVSATHTYQNSGVYTARLTVTDDTQQTGSASASLRVLGAPSASFVVTSSPGRLPIKAKFDASASSAPNDQIVLYSWDFGDGKYSSGKVVSHLYANEGTYTAVLTIKDDSGLTSSAFQPVTIIATPVARIGGGSKKGKAPFNALLDASTSISSQQGVKIASYEWNFGDGTGAQGRRVNHVYGAIGKYAVTLTVTDANNKRNSTSVEVFVFSRPKAAFSHSPSTGITPAVPVVFDASASYDNYEGIASYNWKFGDGTTSSGKSINHVFGKAGKNYRVTLTVTNAQGYSNSTSKAISVKKN